MLTSIDLPIVPFPSCSLGVKACPAETWTNRKVRLVDMPALREELSRMCSVHRDSGERQLQATELRLSSTCHCR